jgi:hypothetical protein
VQIRKGPAVRAGPTGDFVVRTAIARLAALALAAALPTAILHAEGL